MRERPLQAIYRSGCIVFGAIVWFGVYIYCITSYGLLELVLGYIPAAIFAVVLCWMWPLVAFLLALVFAAAGR